MLVSGPAIPRPASSAALVLEHIRQGSDLIVECANGEAVTVLDAIEAAAGTLERVSVHQALGVRDRPHHAGAFGDRLRHFSYFLTPKLRESPGAIVTTHKNLMDKVVTEHGVAELRGRSIRERALALIAIAAPASRDELRAAARQLGYL